MSKFFVGQRVRVNCPGSDVNGTETVVRALGVPGADFDHLPFVGVEVEIAYTRNPCFKFAVFEHHELEPILPEGHQPSEFETLHGLLHSLGVEVAA